MLRAALLRFAAGAAALGEPERLLESICVVGLPLATVRPAPPRPVRSAAALGRIVGANAVGDGRGRPGSGVCVCGRVCLGRSDRCDGVNGFFGCQQRVFVQITAKNIGSRHAERRH